MRILVTGAAGFIGAHTAKALLARGDEVVGIDNFNPYYDLALKRARLDELEYNPHFEFQSIDLLEKKSLKGEGINTALQIRYEYLQKEPLETLKIKNTVFTDLFFDQTNIIYVHINSDSTSLMLNKRTPSHTLIF